MFEKGEEAVPVSQQALCGFGHVVVRAGAVDLETPAHSASYRDGLSDKGLPVQMPLLEGVPEGKHSACLGEHPIGEFHRIRASASMLDSPDVSYDVSPAKLTDAVVKSLVRRIHIRTQYARVFVAQDIFEYLCSPGFGHMIESDGRCDQDPKPASQALRSPSGLIPIENRLLREMLSRLFVRVCQGFGDLLVKLADRSQTNADSENRRSYFFATSASHSMETAEMGKKCGESWTNTGSGLSRKLSPVFRPAGATDTMTMVLYDFRLGLRNIEDLMTPVLPSRLVRVWGKHGAAVFAHLGKHRDYVVDLVHGYQLSVCSLVTRLTTGFAFPGFLTRSGSELGLGSIRRRRLGGIRRIGGKKSDLAFQLLHSYRKAFTLRHNLEDQLNGFLRIFVHQLCDFFPGHGKEPKPIF